MGRKPSLTLELDSHTADAGLETRIEAFLDIVHAFRKSEKPRPAKKTFAPARLDAAGKQPVFVFSSGRQLPLTDPGVTVLFPSMGDIASRALAAAFAGCGFNTRAHRPSDEAILRLGRGNTSCKECLPLILTTGTLLDYVQNSRPNGQGLVYFMPTGGGPCRFGQYRVFMEDLIRRMEIADVALFSLSSDNAYAGLTTGMHRRGWWAVVVSDILEDIRALLLAAAQDPPAAAGRFETLTKEVMAALAQGDYSTLEEALVRTAAELATIALKAPMDQIPRILLTGEIFVRRDGLSRRYLTEKLAQEGFAAICSPVAEWIHYSDHLLDQEEGNGGGLRLRGGQWLKKKFMARDEKQIRQALAGSGLVDPAPAHVNRVMARAEPFVSANLRGEAVLTVGSALEAVATQVCGVIAIGPFGCMPNRISESVLAEAMNSRVKLAAEPKNRSLAQALAGMDKLPFLAVESDGSPFPQLINAKLEAFCLRARRLHYQMMDACQVALDG